MFEIQLARDLFSQFGRNSLADRGKNWHIRIEFYQQGPIGTV
jgi:hypothetical protein